MLQGSGLTWNNQRFRESSVKALSEPASYVTGPGTILETS